MDSYIEFEFSKEELDRNKQLKNEFKEVTGEPMAGEGLEPGDIITFRYGMDIESPMEGLIDRMRIVHSWDPEKFERMAPAMLLRELRKMQKSIKEFEKFMKEIEGD